MHCVLGRPFYGASKMAVIGALKFADFQDHISIDYG